MLIEADQCDSHWAYCITEGLQNIRMSEYSVDYRPILLVEQTTAEADYNDTP